MIAVKEFITRLEQGYTEAFLCRGEDDMLYVAKSKRAGITALVKEFMCGHFGREFGLPIPNFELLYASRNAAEHAINEELRDLAETPGFGSKFVTGSAADPAPGLPGLNLADVANVPETLRMRVLLFDWWVLNFDRTDNNPNLLWEPQTRNLIVIDHNLAFGDDPAEDFWNLHIFRAERKHLSDPEVRAMELPRMKHIISHLPGLWNDMPQEWIEDCILTMDRVDETLRRCESDSFWSLL